MVNINTGMSIIGSAPEREERTLIVVGCGRGGTSACAGSIDKLGITTGNNSKEPIFEDTELGYAIDQRNFHKIQAIADHNNRLHKVWAVKRPSLVNSLEETYKIFRNPTYIFVFRDPLSIGKRDSDIQQSNIILAMRKVLSVYQKILDFIEKQNPYGLFVSYEKLVKHNSDFVQNIISLSGLKNIPSDRVKYATEFISENPCNYLNSINTTEFQGHIDSITCNQISGWAHHIKQDKPATLEILSNNIPIGEVVASELRNDVKASGLHQTGYCGFTWTPPDEPLLPKTHNYSIRLKGSNLTLHFPQTEGTNQ